MGARVTALRLMRWLGLLAALGTLTAAVAGFVRAGRFGATPTQLGRILLEQAPFVLGVVAFALLLGFGSSRALDRNWWARLFRRR